MPAIKECDVILLMSGSFKRYAESQLLWNCTVLSWGNFASASRFFCNTSNGFTTDTANIAPIYLLKIDNSKNYSYCDIEFGGIIANYALNGATISATSYIYLAALGTLQRGAINNVAPFDMPPSKALTYNIAKVPAYNSCGLEVTTSAETYGTFVNNDFTNLTSSWRPWIAGFPWTTGVVPVTNDRFLFVSHIGARQSAGIGSLGGPGSVGQLSIAGYKDIYAIVAFSNPTITVATPVLTLTASLYAHLYDKDVRT